MPSVPDVFATAWELLLDGRLVVDILASLGPGADASRIDAKVLREELAKVRPGYAFLTEETGVVT